MRRPLGVGVGVDVIGPKRESRGPKIMDSRKRRLGSVNTGSGSDTDDDHEKKVRSLEMGDIEQTEAKKPQEKAEIDEKPEDKTPISLFNLAILIRKTQCSYHSFLF
jgi:hypothetical protein